MMVSSFVGFLSKYECVLNLSFYPRMIRTRTLIQTDRKYVYCTHICEQANAGRSIPSKLNFASICFNSVLLFKENLLI